MRLDSIFVIATFLLSLCEFSSQRAWAQNEKELTNSIGMKLVLIPKGTFQMGSPSDDEDALDHELRHQVTITRNYYIGATEVTQGQYERVMKTDLRQSLTRATGRSDYSMHPVDSVSWDDAVEFCKRLSAMPEEKKAGRIYRLPTEAEWEFACRAGSETKYCYGNDLESLGDFAWFSENSNEQTHPVGLKKPNAFGLYDMHGNVSEWCNDLYGEYPKGAVKDPFGPRKGLDSRVIRGGSWAQLADRCRSAARVFQYHSNSKLSIAGKSFDIFGFRVALRPAVEKPVSRRWRSSDGKFSVEAAYVSHDSDAVTLKRLDVGKEIKVPLSQLSESDIQFLESLKSDR